MANHNTSEGETQQSNEESRQDEKLLEGHHNNPTSSSTVEVEILPFPSSTSSTQPPLVVYINTA